MTDGWPLVALACMLLGLAGVAWPLFGYGRLLRVLAGCTPESRGSGGGTPPDRVTVLLAVHNERDGVAARLRNLVDTDLPTERLRIVVASDGSTDGTDDVVRAWPDPRVSLVRSEPRAGKSIAQNAGLAAIDGGIVVITDCGTTFDRRTIPELLAPFADPGVGVVDGALRFEPPPGTHAIRAHGAYWDYEGGVRTHESRLGMLATASGAVMAARREVIQPLPGHAGDDCVVPLMAVAAGLRVHRANAACAWDESNADPRTEFRARVRMVVRNWQGTWMFPVLLAPWRRPRIALGLWSHKLLRWCVPIAVLVVLLSAAALGWLEGGAWAWCALVAWFAAAAGATEALVTWWTHGRYRATPLGSFALVCAAFGIGLARVAAGHRIGAYRERLAAAASLVAMSLAVGVSAADAVQLPSGWETSRMRSFDVPRSVPPPFAIALSADGHIAYVGCGGGESFPGGGISAVDVSTGELVHPWLPTGRNCTALARVGDFLVAAWRGSSELTVVDVRSWQVVDGRRLGFLPFDAVAIGDDVIVIGHGPPGGAIARFRIGPEGRLQTVGEERIDQAPYRVFAKGKAAIVTCPPAGVVRWVLPDGQPGARHAVPGAPLAIAGWSGDSVVIASQDGQLHVVSESRGLLRTIDIAPLLGLDRASLPLRLLDPTTLITMPGERIVVGMYRVPAPVIELPGDGAPRLLARVPIGVRMALGPDESGSGELLLTRREGGVLGVTLRSTPVGVTVGRERSLCGTAFPTGWSPIAADAGPDVAIRRSDDPERLMLAFEDDRSRAWLTAGRIGDALAPAAGGGLYAACQAGVDWRLVGIGGATLPDGPSLERAPFRIVPWSGGFLAIDRFGRQATRFASGEFTTLQAPRSRPRSAARLVDGRWIVIHDTHPDCGCSLLDGTTWTQFAGLGIPGWPSAIVTAPSGTSAYVSFFPGWLAEVDASLAVIRKRRLPIASVFEMHIDGTGRIALTSENESTGLLLRDFGAEPEVFRVPGLLDLIPVDRPAGALQAVTLYGVHEFRPHVGTPAPE